jgi:hypothetical protein
MPFDGALKIGTGKLRRQPIDCRANHGFVRPSQPEFRNKRRIVGLEEQNSGFEPSLLDRDFKPDQPSLCRNLASLRGVGRLNDPATFKTFLGELPSERVIGVRGAASSVDTQNRQLIDTSKPAIS